MGKTLYTYVEHLIAYKHRILFACVTSNILEADKLCEKKLGTDPRKMKYVGCRFAWEYVYLKFLVYKMHTLIDKCKQFVT